MSISKKIGKAALLGGLATAAIAATVGRSGPGQRQRSPHHDRGLGGDPVHDHRQRGPRHRAGERRESVMKRLSWRQTGMANYSAADGQGGHYTIDRSAQTDTLS